MAAKCCSAVAHIEQVCMCLQVLHMILGLERLDRIMLFMEEIVTMPTARLSELSVSCCTESAQVLCTASLPARLQSSNLDPTLSASCTVSMSYAPLAVDTFPLHRAVGAFASGPHQSLPQGHSTGWTKAVFAMLCG